MGYLYRLFGNTSSNGTSSVTKLLIVASDEKNDHIQWAMRSATSFQAEVRLHTGHSIQDGMKDLRWADAVLFSLTTEELFAKDWANNISGKVISTLSTDIPISFISSMYEHGAICVPLSQNEVTEESVQHLMEQICKIASM